MSLHRVTSPNARAPHTKYVKQLLESMKLPLLEDWGVAFSAWLLLAGFLVFPGTFTSITSLNLGNSSNSAERWVFNKIKNLPLLGVAGVCSGLGAIGMLIFWIRWRHNYILISQKVFLPGVLQGSSGVLSTVVNVYTAQDRKWNIVAIVSAGVEGGIAVVCGSLFIFYWALMWPMKREHERRMAEHHKSLELTYDDDETTTNVDEEKVSPSPTRPTPSRKATGMSVATSRRSISKRMSGTTQHVKEVKAGEEAEPTPETVGEEEDAEVKKVQAEGEVSEEILVQGSQPKRPTLPPMASSAMTKVEGEGTIEKV